ncbi:serine protease snake-like [Culex pipiens pallens]|uniref:serine protease snake-like n=1 Tax=Culex pipiens pallens TaxID=42434 RepID=UPI0019538F08|nr:serine protease snake-like [Culex pipiens pallens]
MQFSSGIVLALCILFVQGQNIAKEKCSKYLDLTKQKASILFLSAIPKVEKVESSLCSKTVDLIVGGEDAKPGEFPHQAVLGWSRKDNKEEYDFPCGGSLISDRFVLTAAHCLKRGRPEIVRLGVNDISDEYENFVEIDVEQAIRHPSHNHKRSYHDIALVKMAKPVIFSKIIRPACLWTESQKNVTSVIATGFGLTTNNGFPSKILQKVSLDILDKAHCAQYNDRSKFNRNIADEQLCIGSLAGRKDTCSGDSGSPVQVLLNDKDCVYHVLGVTSVGKACGIGMSSAIYTFVAPYVRWIEQTVWGQ